MSIAWLGEPVGGRTVYDDESGFLDSLADDPHDESTRLVYADYLEERGDLRADWLRLEIQFHPLTSLSHRYRPLRKRLRALRPKLPRMWLLAVTREPDEIAPRVLWGLEPLPARPVYFG